ncbi:hypothetical protein [Bifidobacterium subtile]|uniref:hypothetical protein n=1 Tax=Bifidobacterium subtile TaxID=77635 RepID=UPI002F35F4CF
MNDTPMTTPDRPIVVRGAVAHVRSGVAAYGGNPASFDRPLPAGAVAVVPQTVGTLDSSHRSQGVADVGACSGLNGGSMDAGHAAHADNAGTAGSVHDDSVKDGGAHRSSASARIRMKPYTHVRRPPHSSWGFGCGLSGHFPRR